MPVRRNKNSVCCLEKEGLHIWCLEQHACWELQSIMIWGFFSANRTGALHIIEDKINEAMSQGILERNLISSTKKLNLQRRWMFQQDNAPDTQPIANTESLCMGLRSETHRQFIAEWNCESIRETLGKWKWFAKWNHKAAKRKLFVRCFPNLTQFLLMLLYIHTVLFAYI